MLTKKIAFVFVLFLISCTSNIENAVVTRIVDGDTLVISTGEKVRLICIDTPETGDAYASQAKRHLTTLTLNKSVVLERDVEDTDKYGRLLRYVYVNNFSVNKDIVHSGLATIFRVPPNGVHCDEYETAQSVAQEKKIGIWTESNDSCEVCPGSVAVGDSESYTWFFCSCKKTKKISNPRCFRSAGETILAGYSQGKC